MIDHYLSSAASSLVSWTVNKGIEKTGVQQQVLSEQIVAIVKKQGVIAGAANIIPNFGIGTIVTVGSIWNMYYEINQKLGISFDKELTKSIATGIVSNLSGYFTASFILSFIPLPGLGLLKGAFFRQLVFLQAYIYMSLLAELTANDGRGYDVIIRNFFQKNAALVKDLAKKILFGEQKPVIERTVTVEELKFRRDYQASNEVSGLKWLTICAVIAVFVAYYCLTYCIEHEAYTRSTYDTWFGGGFTHTSYNFMWYMNGFWLIASMGYLLFCVYYWFRSLSKYVEIKSMPLSYFALKGEGLSKDYDAKKFFRQERFHSRVSYVVSFIECLFMASFLGAIAYFCWIYCSQNGFSEMIYTKSLFSDGEMVRDIHYTWFVVALCGIGSLVGSVIFLFKIFKSD